MNQRLSIQNQAPSSSCTGEEGEDSHEISNALSDLTLEPCLGAQGGLVPGPSGPSGTSSSSKMTQSTMNFPHHKFNPNKIQDDLLEQFPSLIKKPDSKGRILLNDPMDDPILENIFSELLICIAENDERDVGIILDHTIADDPFFERLFSFLKNLRKLTEKESPCQALFLLEKSHPIIKIENLDLRNKSIFLGQEKLSSILLSSDSTREEILEALKLVEINLFMLKVYLDARRELSKCIDGSEINALDNVWKDYESCTKDIELFKSGKMDHPGLLHALLMKRKEEH